MPRHQEQRLLPYPHDTVLAIVRDVARYPEFLPWCVGARVYDVRDDSFTADLLIGYKIIREKYTSRVHVSAPDSVRIEYLSGPFQRLENIWHFSEPAPGQCLVDFTIDFEFRNKMLQKLASQLFLDVVRKMVGAFEARAKALSR